MVKGKKAQISEASQIFMQSHSKENCKYVMICNEHPPPPPPILYAYDSHVKYNIVTLVQSPSDSTKRGS